MGVGVCELEARVWEGGLGHNAWVFDLLQVCLG